MKRAIFKHLPFFISIFLAINSTLHAQEMIESDSPKKWRQSYNNDEIKIWVNENCEDGYVEFKSEVFINKHYSVPAFYLYNYSIHTKWMYSIDDCYLIEEINEKERYLYYEVDFPWPMENKEHVVKIAFRAFGNDTITLQSESAPNASPKGKLPRIDHTKGYWRITKLGDRSSKVEFGSKAPSGNYPDWLVNMFLNTAPRENLDQLKTLCEENKEVQKDLSWLYDDNCCKH